MSLEKTKVGDLLINEFGYGPGSRRVVKVMHTTPTQVFAGGRKYRRKDGRAVGGTDRWSSDSVRLPKKGELTELARMAKASKIAAAIRDMKDGEAAATFGDLLDEVYQRFCKEPTDARP